MNDTQTIQRWLAARQLTNESPPASERLQPRERVWLSGEAGMQLSDLDDRHKTVLRQLLQRSSWTLAELRIVTSRVGLMPLACLAKLNEWATDTYGDLLLEGQETVTVNLNLKERVQI